MSSLRLIRARERRVANERPQSCNAISAFAPQSGSPLDARHESKGSHDRTAGQAPNRKRRKSDHRGKLQSLPGRNSLRELIIIFYEPKKTVAWKSAPVLLRHG